MLSVAPNIQYLPTVVIVPNLLAGIVSKSLAPLTHADSCATSSHISSISALNIAKTEHAQITEPAKKRGRGRPKIIQGKFVIGHSHYIYIYIIKYLFYVLFLY